MVRTAAHPTLRADPDFREFVELGKCETSTSKLTYIKLCIEE